MIVDGIFTFQIDTNLFNLEINGDKCLMKNKILGSSFNTTVHKMFRPPYFRVGDKNQIVSDGNHFFFTKEGKIVGVIDDELARYTRTLQYLGKEQYYIFHSKIGLSILCYIEGEYYYFVEKDFRKGDVVIVDGVEGVVDVYTDNVYIKFYNSNKRVKVPPINVDFAKCPKR